MSTTTDTTGRIQPKDDGSPAFPTDSVPTRSGMSLRDWFAGQALTGLMARPDERYFPGNDDDLPKLEEWRKKISAEDANFCYRIADAMLAARKEDK